LRGDIYEPGGFTGDKNQGKHSKKFAETPKNISVSADKR
jgi:hypothetical protein